MAGERSSAGGVHPRRILAPQKFVSGLALVGICLFVFWATAGLSIGTVKSMGPGMLPRSLAVMLAIGGAILIVQSFLHRGLPLEQWTLRGPLLLTAGIILFAVTIRHFGLAVAGMLALVVSGFATDEARPREVFVFAVAVTLACIVLFRVLLDMSIPVLIVPGTGIRL